MNRMVHLISTRRVPHDAITVRRQSNDPESVVIELGPDNCVYLDMETVRVLCNDLAGILDVWFDERDRAGKA